jgi:altronate dehydratase small subunit
MSPAKTEAIRIHPDDNVATALAPIARGKRVSVQDGNRTLNLVVRDEILAGHKFSLASIRRGDRIVKYGETMGKASAAIAPGRHVHVHNVQSLRGRGDLESVAATKGAKRSASRRTGGR